MFVSAACPNQIADIAFILDDSTSIRFQGGDDAWERDVLGFVSAIIRGFEILQASVRIGVVKFNQRAEVKITFDQYSNISDLLPAIRALEYDGGTTNIADAMRVTRLGLAFRPDYPKIAILFNDGEPTVEEERTLLEANNLKNTGVEIFTVGVGRVNEEELRQIASSPDASHNYLVRHGVDRAYNYALLDTIVAKLSREICGFGSTTAVSALSPVSPDTATTPFVSPLSPVTPSVSPLSPVSPDTATTPSVSPLSPVSMTSAKPPDTAGTTSAPFTLPPVGK